MDAIFSTLNSFGAFVLLALGFGFVIFVHELGHFLVAKWVDVKVTQFAIGFGPSFLTWRKGLGFRMGSTEAEYNKRLEEGADPASMGETEYRFNYLPLGGYVKMVGQDDMDAGKAEQEIDPRAFNRKPIWARLCVISAGVIMNLIFGLLFFIIAFMVGVKFPPAITGMISPDSPASLATPVDEQLNLPPGLRIGDRVLSVNGKEVEDFAQMSVEIALAKANESVPIILERDGFDQPLEFRVTPTVGPNKLLWIGVSRPISATLGSDVTVPPDLEALGIKPGMTVTKVDGQAVSRYDQIAQIVESSTSPQVELQLTSPSGDSITARVPTVPRLTYNDENQIHLLGFVPATRIEGVMSRTPAATAGILAGDVVKQINDTVWPARQQILDAVRAARENNQPVSLVLDRQGESVHIDALSPNAKGLLGVMLGVATQQPVLAQSLPNSPAEEGINPLAGTRILAVNQTPIHNWADLQRALQTVAAANPEGSSVELTYQLPIGEPTPSQGTLSISADEAQALLLAGWTLPSPLNATGYNFLMIDVIASNPVEAAYMGVVKTHYFMIQTYLTIGRLLQRSVPLSEMRGPVGIAQIGTQTAQQGWPYLMFFLGLISVNLAVFNFLPLPIVDGGLAVMLIIEKIKGSPLSPRILTAVTLAGLAFLLTLVLYITYHDVVRLIF